MPVDLEPLGDAGVLRPRSRLRPDRRWPAPTTAAATPSPTPSRRPATRSSGSTLADPIDLGAEFVRWEVATAIAGAVLGIDPFDQPNVEEAKELTRRAARRPSGARPTPTRARRIAEGDGLTLYGDAALRLTAPTAASSASWSGTSRGASRTPTSRSRRSSRRRRPATRPSRASGPLLRDRTGRATTAGYGPRFLHSTGQLHKGGPPSGWFLQLTADHPADRPIPGWPYTFGQLIDAQAAGDFAAIESHDLPILRVHLGADPDAGLAALERALDAALAA